MTIDEAEIVIKQISCYPYTIETIQSSYQSFRFVIKSPPVRDVLDNSLGKAPVVMSNFVSVYYMNEAALCAIIRENLHAMAKHEIDEWFKYKEERIYNPHKVNTPVTK